MAKKALPSIESLTYEQAFQELESVVALLESGQQALEDSLVLYERGQALAKHCTDLLDKADLRVTQIDGREAASGAGEE